MSLNKNELRKYNHRTDLTNMTLWFPIAIRSELNGVIVGPHDC